MDDQLLAWDFDLLGYAPTESNAIAVLEKGEQLIVAKGDYYEVHRMYGHLICITTYRTDVKWTMNLDPGTEPSRP